MSRTKYPVEGGGRSSRAREAFILRGDSEEAREREAHFYDRRLKPYMDEHHCSVEKALDHVRKVREKIEQYEDSDDPFEDYGMTEEDYEGYLDEDEIS